MTDLRTEQRLLNELDEGPLLLMKAMADLCSEQGRDEEAAGWRFMADNKRQPGFGRRGYSWIVHSMNEDPRTMPTFGAKRDKHLLAYMDYDKEYRDLGMFLQDSARIIGLLIKQQVGLPIRKKRRSLADMPQEERDLRRDIISARQDLREYHFDLFHEAFYNGSTHSTQPTRDGRRLYEAWTNLKGNLSNMLGKPPAKFVSYEEWFRTYRDTYQQADESER